MKKVVFFDVDNVLFKGQSQETLITYLFQQRIIRFSLLIEIILWFFFYKIGFIKNTLRFREKIYLSIFNKMSVNAATKIFDDFYNDKVAGNLYKFSVDRIREHLSNGDELVLLSATLENIVIRIAKGLNIKHCIATSLIIKNNLYTGEIDGVVPYGMNKLQLAEDFVVNNNLSLSECFAYADHNSDYFLLNKVSFPNVVNPDRKLRLIALKQKWPIYDL